MTAAFIVDAVRTPRGRGNDKGALPIGSALDTLERRDVRRAVIAVCGATGVATAMVIARCDV